MILFASYENYWFFAQDRHLEQVKNVEQTQKEFIKMSKLSAIPKRQLIIATRFITFPNHFPTPIQSTRYIMQSELTVEDTNNFEEKLSVEKEFQSQMQACQFFQKSFEDQIVKRKMELKLYQHFQLMLQKSEQHNIDQSIFYGTKVSRQQTVTQAIKYLNYLTQNLNPLSADFSLSLIFLLEYFTINNKFITNHYRIHQKFQNSSDPGKFYMQFDLIKQRVNLEQFLKFKWNHLSELSFHYCGWFSDDDWGKLIKCAGKFRNLKIMLLTFNNITEIKEGDIELFKSFQWVDLGKIDQKIERNQLNQQRKNILERLKEKNKQLKIFFKKQQL